jgi:response regulator RpfG family c-di-GMP phosphodiesterase
VGGEAGLDILKTKGPFSIVTSDLRMPNMDGVSFLSQARQISPDTVRVLLTGQGDMDAAIAAVNDGNIFRFLTKTCATAVLVKSLAACAEQYRLVTSERILLEQTLRGSIKTLTDILARSNPAAFGRATRVRQSVSEMMDNFAIKERWPVEVAAMLSQIGFVTLPPTTQEKLYKAEPLTESEQAMADRVPRVIEQLLANIPRLDLVREILGRHLRHFAGEQKAGGPVRTDPIPWGARALRIALDHDLLESENDSSSRAFDVLRGRIGCYDTVILEAFAELRGRGRQEVRIHELTLREIVAGMIFDEDVKSSKGLLLIARGQEVTPGLLERVRNFSSELGIRQPIRMIERPAAASSGMPPATSVAN